jgi:predicted nucleic-acid-binding protein
VLESSIYQADRATVAAAVEAALALPAIEVKDDALLQRAVDLYSQRGMDWIDAYLVATAIASKAGEVVSFDRFDPKVTGSGVPQDGPPSGSAMSSLVRCRECRLRRENTT